MVCNSPFFAGGSHGRVALQSDRRAEGAASENPVFMESLSKMIVLTRNRSRWSGTLPTAFERNGQLIPLERDLHSASKMSAID